MTRDELLEMLRAHKIQPTKTRYLKAAKSAECVSGCRLTVDFGRSLAAAFEEHQAEMIAGAGNGTHSHD